jgi:hypothetical protein
MFIDTDGFYDVASDGTITIDNDVKDGKYYPEDSPGHYMWIKDCKWHRITSPALVYSETEAYYYKNDKYHNLKGSCSISGEVFCIEGQMAEDAKEFLDKAWRRKCLLTAFMT